ncbi:MAG: glycine betaine ABC transporter substrate-binding protein [Kiritimatiellae bacterium]|jgi:glycine betaine/proline transport system substrate-binding protein|nr:glycine betaine ABC transporter substrate-binding protein [Kiritimatiellia bacterium]MDY0149531.1 glycine betaine ABC transporter substrate-binding protein [Kiritimatiellia bacterium]
MKKWTIIAMAMACIMGAVGCGTRSSTTDKQTIKLAYVNWAEGVAVTHLLSALLEDMGYDVQSTMADVAPIYVSVAEGQQDVMVETWLPVTHAAYYEQYGDQVELIGTWFDAARIGLVVPTYVEIDSLEQLNDTKDQFKQVLTGIDSGAGIMGATEKAIDEYGLDFRLMASSGPAMTAALKGAIDKGEWIAVTGWAPHWKFARYDLKFLDDPKGVYGATEKVQTAARLGFADDYPDAAALIGKMKFDGVQIGSLMDALEAADGDEMAAVRQWIADNQELVQSWMP